jgi:hypothetical protein
MEEKRVNKGRKEKKKKEDRKKEKRMSYNKQVMSTIDSPYFSFHWSLYHLPFTKGNKHSSLTAYSK